MIVQCTGCNKYFDDEFRDTGCPHDTFAANMCLEGRPNEFEHVSSSYLSNLPPSTRGILTDSISEEET